MINSLTILMLVMLSSIGDQNFNLGNSNCSSSYSYSDVVYNSTVQSLALKDTTVKFLWCAKRYNEELQDTVNSIFINEDYCKTITDPERAALGFVATFIGNECWWDDEAKDDRSNLKCKILTALNLGYQCSEQHLGFLRKWFRNDKESLMKLEDCPTTPYTSTIQDTFKEINITIKEMKFRFHLKHQALICGNKRIGLWSETDYLLNLKMTKFDYKN